MSNKLKLELNKIINECSNSNELKLKLKEKIPDITIKEDDNIILIANTFKNNITTLSELENECKNIILDKNLNILVYTSNSLYYNDDAKFFTINNNININYTKEIYESYEGTILTIFNYDNKWYLSTRKCIDADLSKWYDKTYKILFCETINDTFENFTNKLNENNYYSFVLVHYENKNIIDYSSRFGKEYKKLIHLSTKNTKTHEEIETEIFNDFSYILKQKALSDYNLLNNENKKLEINLPLNLEGLIIKLKCNKTNKTILLKYQTNAYNIINKIKPNYNCLLKIFIELYKKQLLKEHISYFPNNKQIKLFDSANNSYNIYNTIGIIDLIFKILTSELFEIFKLLYNLKDCSHKNSILYESLPKKYKIILYKIRGIYFNKKDYLINKTKTNIINYTKTNLKIIDIYNILKQLDIEFLIKLLKSRNSIISNENFINVSKHCDEISLKLINVIIDNLK